MRIHTDILTGLDVQEAVQRAGLNVTNYRTTNRGSRSRAYAFDIRLTGTSNRPPGWGQGEPGDRVATWDEWGMFLAELFRRDPFAVVPHVYESGEHFRWVTGARFDDLTPADQCCPAGHRWGPADPNLTGTYRVAKCQSDGCTAIHRSLAYGVKFEDLAP